MKACQDRAVNIEQMGSPSRDGTSAFLHAALPDRELLLPDQD
jgi:hypothetical protein